MKRLIIVIAAIMIGISGTFSRPAIAEESSKGGGFLTGQWMLGAGAWYETSPYKGADDEILPVPLIFYQGDRFFIRYNQLGCKLIEWNNIGVSAIGIYRLDGYEEDDSDFLNGMDDRNSTIDIGLNIEFETGHGELELELLTDALGEHKGQEVKVSWEKNYRIKDRWSIEPSIGLSWQSSKLADYYYGVKTTEATSSRPAYNVGSALNWKMSLKGKYKISDHWMLMSGIEVELLDSDINDSPIVDNDTLFSGMLGIIYRF